MAQLLRNFEFSAMHFAGQLLVPGGIIVVLIGLCIWLGGLRWIKFLAAGFGALGGLIGACIFSSGAAGLIGSALLGGGFGCFLKKPVIIFFGAALAGVTALVISVAPAIAAGGDVKPPLHPMPYEDGQRKTLTVSQSAVELGDELLFWMKTITSSVEQSSIAAPTIASVAALIVIGGGVAMPRFVAAVTCASLGTLTVFAGMILVLLYKGARPLTGICEKSMFFLLTVLAMVVFGTFVQLLLCPARRKRPQGKSETSGEK